MSSFKSYSGLCNHSGKHETIGEFVTVINRGRSCLPDELINVPFEVLLEYTFALDCVLFENSIEARFGGSRLPTTVKDLHEVITNDCNLVAVKVYSALVSFSVKLYTSVCRLPILVVRNGGIHLGFDLTHERRLSEV